MNILFRILSILYRIISVFVVGFTIVITLDFIGKLGGSNVTELYETNKEFKEYVDKYAESRGIQVSEAFEHQAIKSYADYLLNKDK